MGTKFEIEELQRVGEGKKLRKYLVHRRNRLIGHNFRYIGLLIIHNERRGSLEKLRV